MSDINTQDQITLFGALFEELVRAGVLTDDMVENVALRFDGLAHEYRGSDGGEQYSHLAFAARLLPGRARAPTVSERRAEYERRQMRERTAILERRAKEQGND
ncbi:hypothetical protein CA235_07470 [Sphingomonas sp. ABOLF]|uniref:hypothetical protein n=1 Tax=Sphingomonas sp. ABOLF TaxID=1985879 RepID=UPI000F7F3939|nr:hypothetical protein [Sphingomonas sp. ABOLF]RSV15682.1 hypothetical protein CA235_07470 [Sphingomonas sp. ABOLF]